MKGQSEFVKYSFSYIIKRLGIPHGDFIRKRVIYQNFAQFFILTFKS